MKVIAWIFLIILILIAVLAVGMGILSHIRAAEREERTIELQQENLIYKEKIERLCVFPSGYAPTVSGKMFNLTDYNIAIKDTIFDVKKDVVYGASRTRTLDRQRTHEFRELRPNGIRYEVVNNQCYVSDIILPLTFDHKSHKISVGGVDWDQDLYDRGEYHNREDFFAHICLKKSCERKPPEPIPPNAKVYDIRDPKENVESFEDKRFPDVIFYADPVFAPYQDRSGKTYQEYVFYTSGKNSDPTYSDNFQISTRVYAETTSTLESQEKPSFFKSSAFEDQVKPNTIFYRKISGNNSFDFYIDGGSIDVESFSTNVLPIMSEFIHAVQAYPQQFISDRAPQ